MGVRRLLNAAYAALARNRDEEGLAQFDKQLEAPVRLDGKQRQVSRGVDALMAVLGTKLPTVPPTVRRGSP